MSDNTTAIATIGLVIVTLLLAGLTGYYAWQTKQMVNEMVKARKLALAPILTCRLTVAPEKTNRDWTTLDREAFGEYSNLRVENVGNCPALNVELVLELLNPTKSTWNIPKEEWSIGTLKQDTEYKPGSDLGRVTERATRTNQNGSAEVQVTITYYNPYQLRFRTDATFELMPLAGTLPFQWSKKDETTTIDKE
jgi:hypothetical protein